MDQNNSMYGDAYSPAQIAVRVQNMGVTKARAEWPTLFVLALLAGAYISLGGFFYAVVTTGSEVGFGLTRLFGGLAFCLGLILVVIGGAELFTGNNLIAMAWAGKLVTTRQLLRNWTIVYLGNVMGSLAIATLVYMSSTPSMYEGEVGHTLVKIYQYKVSLSTIEVLARGILCNMLVCLAVWLALGGHSVTDKILAILFPVTGFVVMGFEHSIANWFFLPLGHAISTSSEVLPAADMLHNILWATIGNIIGGTLLVAGVYWLAYLRPQVSEKSTA